MTFSISRIAFLIMEGLKSNQDLLFFMKALNIGYDDFKALSNRIFFMLKFKCSEEDITKLHECLRLFCKNSVSKWKKSFRNETRFLLKNRFWLSLKFTWPKYCNNTSGSSTNKVQRKLFLIDKNEGGRILWGREILMNLILQCHQKWGQVILNCL